MENATPQFEEVQEIMQPPSVAEGAPDLWVGGAIATAAAVACAVDAWMHAHMAPTQT